MLTEHQRIIFNGDGYSDAWVEEAERRGLPNIRSMVDAIPALTTDKAIAMFEKFGVFTKAELESREEIQYEIYAKEINIEARAMIDMASKTLILPAVIGDTNCSGRVLSMAVKAACECAPAAVQTESAAAMSAALLAEAKAALATLEEVTDKAA